MASVTIILAESSAPIRPRVEVDLDGDVADQVSEATMALGEDLSGSNFKIVAVSDLDAGAVKELMNEIVTVAELETLASMLMDYDEDVVAAALILESGDIGHAKDKCENAMSWVGAQNEDEKDYVAYAISEGLMGADTIAMHFDYERYGDDALMDVRWSELPDGRIVVWNSN